MSFPIPDKKIKVPSFEEVMADDYQPPKVPSYEEVMGEDTSKKKDLSNGWQVGESEIPSTENPPAPKPVTAQTPKIKSFDEFFDKPLPDVRQPAVKDNTYMEKPISEDDKKEATRKRELHEKDMDAAIENTTDRRLKQKGIKVAKNSTIYNLEKQKVRDAVNNGDASFHKYTDPKTGEEYSGLDRSIGTLEGLAKGWNEATENSAASYDFVHNMNDQQKVDYLNEQGENKEIPDGYMGEALGAAGSVAHFVSNAAPTLIKAGAGAAVGTALVAAAPESAGASLAGLPTVAAIAATTPDMVNQGAKDEIIRRYRVLKSDNPNVPDVELMKQAREGGESAGAAGGFISNAMMMGEGGGVAKSALSDESKNLLSNILTKVIKPTVKSAANVARISAATTGAEQLEGNLEGIKTKPEEIAKNMVQSYIDNGTNQLALGLAIHAGSKIVKSGAKYILTKEGKLPEIQEDLQQKEDAGITPPGSTAKVMADLNGYKTALDKTSDGLSPESQASVAGLIQKKDNLKEEMKGKDESQHENYQKQIDAIDFQIKEINRTNKPFQHEITETGETLAKPTFDDVAKERIEDLADKISKGKRVEDIVDIQSEQNFPEELDKQLNRILKEKKSKNKDKENPNTDLSDNIEKYFKSKEKEGKPEEISQPIELSIEPKEKAEASNILNSAQGEEVATKTEPVQEINNESTQKEPEVHQPSEAEVPTITESNKEIKPAKEGESEPPKPPTEEPVVVNSEGEGTGIRHIDTKDLRDIHELGDYEKEVQTVEKWRNEATERIKKGELPDLLKKMEAGDAITDVEQMMMGQHIANLNAEVVNNPSVENVNALRKAIDLSDKVGGSAWGRSGRARQESFLPDDSLGNFLLDKEATQGAKLTEPQIKSETAKYNELKKAKDDLAAALEVEKEKNAKLIAEIGFNKAKAQRAREAKKSHQEYKVERSSAIEGAREALKKLRTGETGVTSRLPLANELAAIAPHVKKYVQSLVNEGIDKLDNVVTEVHAEFKDILEGISKTDILNIIGGNHDIKGETRNDKAASIHLLKREVNLLKELSDVRKGLEKAKSEKETVEKNRRIEELEKKIKEIRDLNKDTEPVEKTNAERLATRQKQLINKIEKLQGEIKTKKYSEEPKKLPPLAMDKKTSMLQNKVIELENKIKQERMADEYAKKSKWIKWYDKVMRVLGIRRIVQSAVDLSIPFRQGATLISPRRIGTWVKSFGKMLRSVFSQEKYNKMMYEIRHSPQYHEMVKDGLVFNDLDALDPNARNEDFQRSFVYDIPVIKEPLLASNRAADAFLNSSRYDLYMKFKNNLERAGITRQSDPKAYEDAAKWAMNMTGRGNLLEAFEHNAMQRVLGNTFYGARLMASRFNMLNPATYIKMHPKARLEAMKDITAWAATTVAAGAALAAAGGKISTNPDDSDFMQLREGKKVYDISGGMSIYLRTYLRLTNAIYTKMNARKHEGNKATEKAGESAVKFLRNKLSPNTGYAADAYFGKSGGQEFNPYEILQVYPMYVDDTKKALEADGPVALATVLLPNLVGIGFGNYAAKGVIDDNLEDLKARNKRTDEQDFTKLKSYKRKGLPATDKEIDQYIDKRDSIIDKGITQLFNKGKVVIENGKAVLKSYKELTKEEVVEETSSIKSKATREAKKEVFGEESDKDKRNESKDKKKIEKKEKQLHLD